MEEQLRKDYFKLLFLYAISNGLDNLIFEIFNQSFYGDGLYLNIDIIYNEFVTILKELSVDVFNKYKVMPTFESKYNGDCKNSRLIRLTVYALRLEFPVPLHWWLGAPVAQRASPLWVGS